MNPVCRRLSCLKYSEHSFGQRSEGCARSVTSRYRLPGGRTYFGAGIDTNIEFASDQSGPECGEPLATIEPRLEKKGVDFSLKNVD